MTNSAGPIGKPHPSESLAASILFQCRTRVGACLAAVLKAAFQACIEGLAVYGAADHGYVLAAHTGARGFPAQRRDRAKASQDPAGLRATRRMRPHLRLVSTDYGKGGSQDSAGAIGCDE